MSDINAPDSSGLTALIVASAQGNLDVVTWLVEAGADVSVTSDDGHVTALIVACEYSHFHIVRYLLNYCNYDNVNFGDDTGNSALHYTISNCRNGGVTRLHQV